MEQEEPYKPHDHFQYPRKQTWEIDVPLVGVGEKWLAGGNIAATNAEERSFSMFVFSGTENDRAACTVPPLLVHQQEQNQLPQSPTSLLFPLVREEVDLC